jgi:hypothetical protein
MNFRVDKEDAELLRTGRIGMLALNGATTPVIGAQAYYHQDDSIWMTTSRYAQKVKLIRRNPRGSFLVTSPGASLLLQGLLELFDPRSISGQLRAAFNGPRFYTALAGYAAKNLPFIGGYLLELDRVPGRWWPQNRLVMRLRIHQARRLRAPMDTVADPAEIPDVPKDVSRRLARMPIAYACWRGRGGLLLETCYWAPENDSVAIAFERDAHGPSASELPAAVVIEKHHPFRPTLMVGVTYRGELVADGRAEHRVAKRYGFEEGDLGGGFKMQVVHANYWKGFETGSR